MLTPPNHALQRTRHGVVRRHMRAHRKLIMMSFAALLLGAVFVWWLRPAPTSPVKLNLDWFAENEPGGPFAVIRITNQSSTAFHWDVQTFVLRNGSWRRAARQPKFSPSTAHVSGHDWSGINVPVSAEGKKWKVQLSCRRYETRLENAIEGACRFLHLPHPFRESKTSIMAELEFEK